MQGSFISKEKYDDLLKIENSDIPSNMEKEQKHENLDYFRPENFFNLTKRTKSKSYHVSNKLNSLLIFLFM